MGDQINITTQGDVNFSKDQSTATIVKYTSNGEVETEDQKELQDRVSSRKKWLFTAIIIPVIATIVTPLLIFFLSRPYENPKFIIVNSILRSDAKIVIKADNKKANQKKNLNIIFDGYAFSDAGIRSGKKEKDMFLWHFKLINNTCLDILIKKGEHKVKVGFPGGKLSNEFKIHFVNDPPNLSLTIRSNVYDGTVYIDNKKFGSTRLDVNLTFGEHIIKVEKEGYLPFEKIIDFQKPTTVWAKLETKPKPSSSLISENNSYTDFKNCECWIDNYEIISEYEDFLIKNVLSVYNKVLNVMDKDSYPSLIIFRGGGDLLNVSLKDGCIILFKKLIDICYNNVSLLKGDSRIAFVIGVMLSHISKDDNWNLDLSVIHNYSSVKTLHNYSYGILYMTMAGYDPNFIIKDRAFLKLLQKDYSDIDIEKISNYLNSVTKKIVTSLPLFYKSLKLYEYKNYVQSLELLMQFRKNYPSKEIDNNIGCIYYNVALNLLIKCNKNFDSKLLKVSPPFIAKQTVQYLSKIKYKIPDLTFKESYITSNCKDFNDYIILAINFLKRSIEKDPSYVPALLNLSSSYILYGNYPMAIAVLKNNEYEKKYDYYISENIKIATELFMGGASQKNPN